MFRLFGGLLHPIQISQRDILFCCPFLYWAYCMHSVQKFHRAFITQRPLDP